jgi:hypothetical protein
VIIFLSVAAAFVATATATASSADLLLFWGPKAQAFATARTIDPEFLGQQWLEYLHPSYPPLLPNVEALASMVAGRFAWGASTLVFPLFLLLLAAALPPLFRLYAPPNEALAATALTVSSLGYLGAALGIAGNGEMPLLFFEALAATLLVGPWALERGGQAIAGLMLAGAVSTKVEGLAFALGVGVLFLLVRRRQIRFLSAALRIFAPLATCLAVWFTFGASQRLFLGYESYGKTFDIYWRHLPVIISEIGRALISKGWALPYLIPIAVLLSARGTWNLALVPVGTALLLAGFFIFTYLHGEEDPTMWISWSAGRVFLSILVLLAVASVARSGSVNGAA